MGADNRVLQVTVGRAAQFNVVLTDENGVTDTSVPDGTAAALAAVNDSYVVSAATTTLAGVATFVLGPTDTSTKPIGRYVTDVTVTIAGVQYTSEKFWLELVGA
jgi:hypothetical protein